MAYLLLNPNTCVPSEYVAGEYVGQPFMKGMKNMTMTATRALLSWLSPLGLTIAAENRTLRWEDERSAVQLLTFAEAKASLLEGAAVVPQF